MRQAAAFCFLGSKVPKKVKRRVEIWTSKEQRGSMSRSMTAESEHLLRVVRSAALSHEEQYYALRMTRYSDATAKDVRRR